MQAIGRQPKPIRAPDGAPVHYAYPHHRPYQNCGGNLKIIPAILAQPVIEMLLTHLGLQARAQPRALAPGTQGHSRRRPEIRRLTPFRRPGNPGCGDRLRKSSQRQSLRAYRPGKP